MKHLYLLIICLTPAFSFGQLTLGGSNTQEIAGILSGSGVSISNVQYSGSPEAISYFSANVSNMPFQSGFLMTTGSKYFASGPNNQTNASSQIGTPGHNLLTNTLGTTTNDAAVIEMDIVPSGTKLSLNFIFGSEEYSTEYSVSSDYSFNDGFAIYLSGPGISGQQNIARLPNTGIVSIRSLNPTLTNQYLVSNGTGNDAPFNTSSMYLQYDQLSIPLTASIDNLSPGFTYHLILAIADGGDQSLDSGVFLEEGGVTASMDENTLENFVSVGYNPSNQQATIQITEYRENLTYSVVDLSGKVMQQSKITETTNIDLSSYASGMYLIRVEGNTGQVSKKVVR